MERSQYHAARDRVLWHVVACKTNERFSPRTAWWFDNRRRAPAGMVIFQVIESGRCVLRGAAGDSEVSAGQAFLFAYGEATSYGRPPDRPDWPGWSDDLRTAHISLGGAGLLEHWDVLRARFGPIVQLGGTPRILALLRDIERRCDRDPRADRRAVSPAVHGFVMTLFDEIEAAATLGLAPVERAVDDLLRTPLSGDPLKEIARRHGCTREHLTRV
nr:hypothetical protein [Planctomycetota bacterium]